MSESYYLDGQPEAVPVVADDFRVNSREAAEWVLDKMLECDSALAAIAHRRKVITDSLDTEANRIQNRKLWLERRFNADLEEFAKRELEGKKVKSIPLTYGTLAFRKRPERVVVKDADAAGRLFPHAYVTQAPVFQPSLLSKANLDEIKTSLEREDVKGAFYIEPEREVFSVKTTTKKEETN